jgi:hypothetical protein
MLSATKLFKMQANGNMSRHGRGGPIGTARRDLHSARLIFHADPA